MNKLRDLKALAKSLGVPMDALTVLTTDRDPYRCDTPAKVKKAEWLRDCYEEFHDGTEIHLRGFHYKLVGRATKLNGETYINTDKNWDEIQEYFRFARYLNLIPYEALVDKRNAPPLMYTPDYEDPTWVLQAGEVVLELPETLEPQYKINGNLWQQPYRQVVLSEKQGVETLLKPLCFKREATLAMPSGEVSTTMVRNLMRASAEDGRPLVFHQLGDFDMSGWQMAISTGRKIQAIQEMEFPELDVILHPIGLTREQCIDWNLPSSPVKDTDPRAADWVKATGREQTELDAAVALVPSEFVKMVDASLLQYFDRSLLKRGRELKKELVDKANTRLAGELGEEVLAKIREEADEKLVELEELAESINEQLTVDPDELDISVPEDLKPLMGDSEQTTTPMVDTGDWIDSTENMINRKKYRTFD